MFDVAEEFGSFAGWHFMEFNLWYELNDKTPLFAIKCLFEFAIVESVSLLSPNLYGLKISLLFG